MIEIATLPLLSGSTIRSAQGLCGAFASAAPGHGVEIESFLDANFATALVQQFPGVKQVPDAAELGPAYRLLNEMFGSQEFLQWITNITQIPGLAYEPDSMELVSDDGCTSLCATPLNDGAGSNPNESHRLLKVTISLQRNFDNTLEQPIAHPLSHQANAQGGASRALSSLSSCSIVEINAANPVTGRSLTEHHTLAATVAISVYFSSEARSTAISSVEMSREISRADFPNATLLAEARLPILGYAAQLGPALGLFSDHWIGRRAEFEVRAIRPVCSVTIKGRAYDGLPEQTVLRVCTDGGTPNQIVLTLDGPTVFSFDHTSAANEIIKFVMEVSSTASPARLGRGNDKRELGFHLHNVVFEHAS